MSLEETQRLQKLKDTLVDIEKNYIRFQAENKRMREALNVIQKVAMIRGDHVTVELTEKALNANT